MRVNPCEPAALNIGNPPTEPEDAAPDAAADESMNSAAGTLATDLLGDARETPATLDAFLTQQKESK